MNRSARSSQGFTLIELLIAITIIAVLATVGFVAFQGITVKARDDKRVADLNAIRNAMEANYTSGAYVDLAASQFGSGQFPVDPSAGVAKCAGTNLCQYCVQAAKAAVGASCTTGVVGANLPAAGASYIVCANLEGTINGSNYYCVSNAQ